MFSTMPDQQTCGPATSATLAGYYYSRWLRGAGRNGEAPAACNAMQSYACLWRCGRTTMSPPRPQEIKATNTKPKKRSKLRV